MDSSSCNGQKCPESNENTPKIEKVNKRLKNKSNGKYAAKKRNHKLSKSRKNFKKKQSIKRLRHQKRSFKIRKNCNNVRDGTGSKCHKQMYKNRRQSGHELKFCASTENFKRLHEMRKHSNCSTNAQSYKKIDYKQHRCCHDGEFDRSLKKCEGIFNIPPNCANKSAANLNKYKNGCFNNAQFDCVSKTCSCNNIQSAENMRSQEQTCNTKTSFHSMIQYDENCRSLCYNCKPSNLKNHKRICNKRQSYHVTALDKRNNDFGKKRLSGHNLKSGPNGKCEKTQDCHKDYIDKSIILGQDYTEENYQATESTNTSDYHERTSKESKARSITADDFMHSSDLEKYIKYLEEFEKTKGVYKLEQDEEQNILSGMLNGLGLKFYPIPGDGNCLFSSLTHQLNLHDGNNLNATLLRQLTAGYIRQHKWELIPFMYDEHNQCAYTNEKFEYYCNKIEKTNSWGGQMEIEAISRVFECPIKVLQVNGQPTIHGEHLLGPTLTIIYNSSFGKDSGHYDSTTPL